MMKQIPERPAFWIVVISALALLIALNLLGPPANTTAPLGIVSFELAGSAQAANAVLVGWSPADRLKAAFSIGLDFLFIPLYAAAIGWGALKSGWEVKRRGWPLARLARTVVFFVGTASALDVLENGALMQVLFAAEARSPWPEAARWLAIGKFGLLFISLVYVFYGAAIAGMSALTGE